MCAEQRTVRTSGFAVIWIGGEEGDHLQRLHRISGVDRSLEGLLVDHANHVAQHRHVLRRRKPRQQRFAVHRGAAAHQIEG